ncbi:hypothetical protein [Salipiger bermudensis]|uniref:hypothetical protein n=1 Tax=Salipiger bermudensis TaxID=344736 RepID=UPI001CD74BE6|nr:hypothetical protein [Salipiger bermudensis]MCA0961149.1 hypothetical protein [Salipiger bermudensis]
MNMLDRRGFFKSASAALAATATPALAYQMPITETPHPDPIRDWLNQWSELKSRWMDEGHDATGEETEHGQILWNEADALERKITSTEARSADGALAQLEWMLADSTGADFQYGHREALELAVEALKGRLV